MRGLLYVGAEERVVIWEFRTRGDIDIKDGVPICIYRKWTLAGCDCGIKIFKLQLVGRFVGMLMVWNLCAEIFIRICLCLIFFFLFSVF